MDKKLVEDIKNEGIYNLGRKLGYTGTAEEFTTEIINSLESSKFCN